LETLYPNLFSPITIGGVTFKNRIWSAPAGTHLLAGLEEYPNEAVIAYYANKAKGGSANITFSAQNMDIYKPQDDVHAHENIFPQKNHRMWRQLTDAVHYYGAKISLELLAFEYHGYEEDGRLVSYTVNGHGKKYPKLTQPVMEKIAETYADAAEAALDCGFDMILIHGGHGLVLSQMLSPKFNTRKDEFGGSLENRAKFPIMILDAIRQRVGRKLLIEYRISGSELTDGGFTTDDCVAFLKLIQDKIDIAHISCGSFYSETEHIMHPNNFLPAGCNAYLARAVKESGEIHIPVLTLGAFQHPDLMEETIKTGGADLVAMARGTISDAFVPDKALHGKADEIIPCIRCFHCLDYGRNTAFACSVNPTVGREYRLKLLEDKPQGRKKVVVIGGGPAGMEAAMVAARRGHHVTLLEQDDHLGGKLIFSRQAAFKKDLEKFLDYQIHMVEKLGVQVQLNTHATPELVAEMAPDAVLAAVGADPVVPNIPGVDGGNVITAEQCYHLGRTGGDLGQHIAILGGGLVGCETALYLAMYLHKQVTLIEMTGAIAQEEYSIPRQALVEHMNQYVTYYCGARCTAITPEGMEVADSYGNRALIPADTVVLAAGMRARSQQAEQFRGLSLFFEPIGDCVVAKNVRGATRSGYDAASRI
jgi:2,4-dienoyl-CoA reductase-like NADH-dependent reductase (Old Yellow Enzyme family)/NADPH-dependent 2,4-dienoyl-CoA reductase/sulfur reductase-like enzyme